MDYGKPKAAVAAASGFGALSLMGQVGVIVGAVALVIVLAAFVRYGWRRHRAVNEH